MLSVTFAYHVFAQIRQSDPRPIVFSSGLPGNAVSDGGGQVCSTGVVTSTAGD